MKTRFGFVSNSSSSSFVCELCGNTEEGYEMSLSAAGMGECVNGHIICIDEFIDDKKSGEYFDEWMDSSDGDNYSIPAKFCPICQLETLPDSTLVAFVSKTIISENELTRKIKERFGTHDELLKFLRS
jgi:hypothetical protein